MGATMGFLSNFFFLSKVRGHFGDIHWNPDKKAKLGQR